METSEVLLGKIKDGLEDLEDLLSEANSHWWREDRVYRFYHHSFKVYNLLENTEIIVAHLKSLDPKENPQFCALFEQIFFDGTGKQFEDMDNYRWAYETRPIVEAFMHAHYFLEMAVKYGKEYESLEQFVDSGWAALLELYMIR